MNPAAVFLCLSSTTWAAATAWAAGPGPCDILSSAGNPCVAAHSTTRALYAAYMGPLYNITRLSDGASINISVLQAGGFANTTAHDAFCPNLDCVFSQVYDQTPMRNHLHQRHKLVNASQHPILVGDSVPVYGMYFDPGFGYHQDNTTGIPVGNEPESIYAVMSGTHFNGACCCRSTPRTIPRPMHQNEAALNHHLAPCHAVDYGNSETDDTSDGAGAMEAVRFHVKNNGQPHAHKILTLTRHRQTDLLWQCALAGQQRARAGSLGGRRP
jgi:hypothetical protein